MAPLAKLPVFWSLEGQRAIVAGGSDAAAWKAELLAACGAEVHIYAETLSEAFEALIRQPAAHPGALFIHHAHPWHDGIFAGAELAIADCDDDAYAMAFASAAHAAGVPANIIDKPAFCRFQFGSIVNRSPVVVAISTDGAAPVLAQAIRRRIEALLPQSLKTWAEMAQALRETINARLSPGPQRRAFWERFVDRAFGPAPDGKSETALLADVAMMATERHASGRVTLVGTDPDDAELLTLKAVRALQAADLIVFDDGISPDILELARREAKRLPVKKRRDIKGTDVDDTNETMAAFAATGKRVVRLKATNPLSAPDAAEESAFLCLRGIPVDIIPGVMAMSASQPNRMPAKRGLARYIPLDGDRQGTGRSEPVPGSQG